MKHQHIWQPAQWDTRYEKCKYCPAARFTAEEAERQRIAGWAAADKRQQEYEAQRQAAQ